MTTVPLERLERVPAWGMASDAVSYVYRPTTVQQLKEIFETARRAGLTIGLRGAGRSYGDASLNASGITLDLTRMNRILEWDPDTGVIEAEPGVTIGQMWRYILGDGWWPAVVPGTMFPTLGGSLGMNIHGKNNWQSGPIGEHVQAFEALLPDGTFVSCSREENADLFHAMIGGAGLLGCFTRIRLKAKRIYSGDLEVYARSAPNLASLLDNLDSAKDEFDYAVGWVDCMVRGDDLGRGEIHYANYPPPGADPTPAQSLRLEYQDLPETFFGVIPRSAMWMFMRPLMHKWGVRLVNTGRYWAGVRNNDTVVRQSLAEFNFLLDYVPGWKKAYLPGGLIQHQSFIPIGTAEDTFRSILEVCHRNKYPPHLGVAKRHRPDNFLLSHAVDGYSLALDFRVHRSRRGELATLLQALDELVLLGGGRFYFAKDSALRPESARAFLGNETLQKLAALKQRCDPDGLLQTNLARRVFPDLMEMEPDPAQQRLLNPEEAG